MKISQILKKNDITLQSLFFIIIGTLLLVIGINVFISPAGLLPTGFTGISYEMSYISNQFFNIDIAYNIFYFILNIPIIIFGYIKVGNKFLFKTIISIVLFTIFAQVIPQVGAFPIESSGDVLISGLIAAILIGSGTGLILRVGASTGGSDIIAIYMSLFKGKPFGLYSFIINSFVILISFIITHDIKLVAITLIHLYILNSVIDLIHNSQEKRTLIIITNNCEQVRKNIINNFYRGLTILESKGGFSAKENNTLIISISYGELHQMTKLIKDADPNAFINILKTDAIIGNFENPYQKML